MGISLLLALSPLAFQGRLKTMAILLAILVGIGNGVLHIAGSLWFRRMMPGTVSAPLLIVAGGALIWAAR